MVLLAYLALFGVPLFAALHVLTNRGSARSVATAIVAGWLAMPLLRLEVGGLPEIDKEGLLASSVLVATLVGRLGASHVRLRWFDLPMIAYCGSPMLASLDNGLGAWDGFSSSLRTFLMFGTPWFVGRFAIADARAMVDVGRALLLGAVCYSPLCLAESRLAPQLHQWLFGIPGRTGWETVDFYGPLRWKASVFLQSPLELTPLMGVGFLFGWWMWKRLRVRSLLGHSMPLLVGAALFACLMGKSLGGISLTVIGAGALWLTRRTGSRVFLAAVMAIGPAYLAVRATQLWDGMSFVEFLQENVSERRAESFLTRVDNENRLVVKALERPWFGWGGWGRNRVFDEEGKDITITDGFWIIVLGTSGWFGLGSWLVAMLLPVMWTWWRHWHVMLRSRGDEAILPCAIVVPVIHLIDCLPNCMPCPVYYMVAGGLATVASRRLLPVTAVVESKASAAAAVPRLLTPRHRHVAPSS